MKVSVAICTWNRASLLDQTLRAMKTLTVPKGVQWELLIVNNNSTDETDEVIERHSFELPIVRLFERRAGKSHAANCAITHAIGDLLIWTDDDVIVDQMWMCQYVNAATRWHEAGYFGGRIRPWFERTPPRWIKNNSELLAAMLVLRDLGDEEEDLGGRSIYGANMAFRMSRVRGFLFDTRIGPCKNTQVRGEEDELISRFRAAGIPGVWVPSAQVQHFVGRERSTLRFLWRYHVGSGRTSARLAGHVDSGPKLFGAPRWKYRQLAQAMGRLVAGLIGVRYNWVKEVMQLAYEYGFLAECWGRTRQ